MHAFIALDTGNISSVMDSTKGLTLFTLKRNTLFFTPELRLYTKMLLWKHTSSNEESMNLLTKIQNSLNETHSKVNVLEIHTEWSSYLQV